MTGRRMVTLQWTTSSTSSSLALRLSGDIFFDELPCYRAIVRTLRTYDAPPEVQPDVRHHTEYPVSAYITHLVYLAQTEVEVDELALTALGVKCIRASISRLRRKEEVRPLFEPDDVRDALRTILHDG